MARRRRDHEGRETRTVAGTGRPGRRLVRARPGGDPLMMHPSALVSVVMLGSGLTDPALASGVVEPGKAGFALSTIFVSVGDAAEAADRRIANERHHAATLSI